MNISGIERHILQSTLVGIVAVITLAIWRPRSAQLRYLVWLAVVIKFALPSELVARVLARLPFRASAATLQWGRDVVQTMSFDDRGLYRQIGFVETARQTGSLSDHASSSLLGLSLLISLCIAVGMVRRVFQVRALTRRASASGSPVIMAAFGRALRGLNITRRVAVRVALDATEPFVIGVLEPIVVLPYGIDQHLSAAELEAVFCHELAHVRRWDNLVSWVDAAIVALFWFNPLVWIASRRISAESENACDDMVVSRSLDPRTFARALAKTARFCIAVPATTSVGRLLDPALNLSQRLERLRGNAFETPSRARQCVVAGIGTIAVGLVAPLAFWPSDVFARSSIESLAERPGSAFVGDSVVQVEIVNSGPVEIRHVRAVAMSASDIRSAGAATTAPNGNAGGVWSELVIRNNDESTMTHVAVVIIDDAGTSRLYFEDDRLSLAPGDTASLELGGFPMGGQRPVHLRIQIVGASFADRRSWGRYGDRAPTAIAPPSQGHKGRATAALGTSAARDPLRALSIRFVAPGIVRKSPAQMEADAIQRVESASPPVDGVVVVAVSVDVAGFVRKARPASGQAYGLRDSKSRRDQDAALDAALKWRFAPTVLRQGSVSVEGDLIFHR